jgi:hypothetical protein
MFKKWIYIGITIIGISFLILTTLYAENKVEEKSPVNIQNLFYSTGWMGDGEYGKKYIDFNGSYKEGAHSEPTCIKITYKFGPKRWGGIYWQNQPDNWGDKPGSDYSKQGFKKITFWAKGTTGKEVIEFKAGCIDDSKKQYRDSFCKTIGRVSLSKEWAQYTIAVEKENLSSVIGGFCWVTSGDYNEQESITFYLDDIFLE